MDAEGEKDEDYKVQSPTLPAESSRDKGLGFEAADESIVQDLEKSVASADPINTVSYLNVENQKPSSHQHSSNNVLGTFGYVPSTTASHHTPTPSIGKGSKAGGITKSGRGSSNNSGSLFFTDRTQSNIIFQYMERMKIPPWLLMIVAVGIPIAALLTFASLFVVTENTTVDELRWVEDVVGQLTPIVDASHAIRRERGISSEILSTNDSAVIEALMPALYEARNETADALESLSVALASLPSSIRSKSAVSMAHNGIQASLLAGVLVEQHEDAIKTLDAFTQEQRNLADVTSCIVAECPSAKVAKRLARMSMLLRIDNYVGFARDLGLLNIAGPAVNVSDLVASDVETGVALDHIEVTTRTYESMLPTAFIDESIHKIDSYEEMMAEIKLMLKGNHKLSGGNATHWKMVGDALVAYIQKLENHIVAENLADIDAGHVRAKLVMTAISIAIVLAVLPALLVIFVSSRTYSDLKEEQAICQHLENTIVQVSPVDIFVALGLDPRSLRSGYRKAVNATLLSIRIWNGEDIARSCGDEKYFRAMDTLFQGVIRIAEATEGQLMYRTTTTMLVIMPTPEQAVSAAMELQMHLSQQNQQRLMSGEEADIHCTLAIHTGPIIIGTVGTNDTIAVACVSGTTAFMTTLHRLAHALKVRLLITGPVLEELQPGRVQSRDLGSVEEPHRRNRFTTIHDVFNLDPEETRARKKATQYSHSQNMYTAETAKGLIEKVHKMESGL
eukprot:PhM_4_TR15098/c0_g1_i1/m.71839